MSAPFESDLKDTQRERVKPRRPQFCSWCRELRQNNTIRSLGYYRPPVAQERESDENEEGTKDEDDVGQVPSQPASDSGAEDRSSNDAPVLSGDEHGSHIGRTNGSIGNEGGEGEGINYEQAVGEQEGQNEDDDGDEDYEDELPEEDPHRLLDVMENAKSCFLCAKIWSAFERWATARYGSLDSLELADARVEIRGVVALQLPDEDKDSYKGKTFVDDDDNDTFAGDLVHGETDDWAQGWLSKANISIIFPDPEDTNTTPGLVGLYAFLQRCPVPVQEGDSNDEESVHNIFMHDEYGPETLEWPDKPPYCARQRPLMADLRLFRKWKVLCDGTHHGRCSRPSLSSSPSSSSSGGSLLKRLRVIDVQRLCLVELHNIDNTQTTTTPWVALSYVWGIKPFVTLTNATLPDLMKEGSLADPAAPSAPASWLPPTIADTIRVTAGLGERYLWVDSLCIVQDLADDKAHFLPLMAVIYGRATVTIVQAAGEDAFHGLPGVRPNTRFVTEEPFYLPNQVGDEDEQVLEEDVHYEDNRGWFMLSHSWVTPDIGHGRWFTRGWTFQEDLLSQRMLIFSPEQVFWECRQAIWHEDAHRELPHHRERHQTIFYDSLFHDETFRNSWETGGEDEDDAVDENALVTTSIIPKFQRLYQRLVHSYTQRTLGHTSDGLHAFAGIMQALTMAYGIEFVWGMPAPLLCMALTWPASESSEEAALQRRQGTCLLNVSNEKEGSECLVESSFPSWAWVGWIGRVYYYELFGYLDGEHAGLEFYHFSTVVTNARGDNSRTAELCRIPQNQRFRNYTYDHKHKPFAGTNTVWQGDTQLPIRAADVPTSVREADDVRYALLAFWTSRAPLLITCDTEAASKKMAIAASTDDDADMRPLFTVWVVGSTQLPLTWHQFPPRERFIGGGGRPGDLPKISTHAIVVGRSSLERLRGRGELEIFLVDTDKFGVSSRYAHASVCEDDWNKLATHKWEKVFLI